MTMERTLYSVSDLISKTRAMLELSFKDIWLEGEVSNVHHHSSGHLYFTIKDNLSELKGVMFKSFNSYLRFQIENGMRLACFGSLSVYEQRGQVQFVTKKIEISGVGTLHQAFEALKNKLEKDGLFDHKHKLELKEIPRKVGILTSGEGAAIEDVLHVISRRSPFLEIVFRPSKVQGEGAADDLSNGLIELSSVRGIDTIIICRGGGSIEDLWAFNEEKLAQTIFNCKVPIISAVGHETDYTISDFVADLRAATPTEAAEIVCLSLEQIFSSFENYETAFTNKVESLSLLNKNKIRSKEINGFQQGEYTHAAVAAFVASGMADVGLGLETPARNFDLDFIPIASERYFVAFNKETLNKNKLQKLISIIEDKEFEKSINDLPGYSFSECGKIQKFDQVFENPL